MSFISRFFQNSPRTETRASSSGFPSAADPMAWAAFFGGFGTTAGEDVTREKAMMIPAVFSAVNVISSTVAGLPLKLYRTEDGQRVEATRDPLYRILHDVVNADGWTSFAWRKWMLTQLLLSGRSYTLIERNKAGRVMGLWPLETSKMKLDLVNGRRIYTYRQNDGAEITYRASEVLDIVWMPAADGICHIDPISQNRESLGLMLAAEKFAAQFFAGGAIPPLVLNGPVASAAGAQRASDAVTQGLREANRADKKFLMTPPGYELKQIGMEPGKTQLLELRQWMITEVARIFNIPPTFLQDHTHSTFSNTESLELHYARHTILPLVNLIEAELNAKLFVNWTNTIEFSMQALERSDYASRTQGYHTLINAGVMTPNEARSLENLPAVGPEGDQLLVQGAMVPLKDAGKLMTAPAPTPEPQDEEESPAEEPGGEEQ